jgi:hypothetical protein
LLYYNTLISDIDIDTDILNNKAEYIGKKNLINKQLSNKNIINTNNSSKSSINDVRRFKKNLVKCSSDMIYKVISIIYIY